MTNILYEYGNHAVPWHKCQRASFVPFCTIIQGSRSNLWGLAGTERIMGRMTMLKHKEPYSVSLSQDLKKHCQLLLQKWHYKVYLNIFMIIFHEYMEYMNESSTESERFQENLTSLSK